MNRDPLTFSHIFLGLLTLSLGIAAISISKGDWQPENVRAGIWGGLYVLAFGILLKIKKVVTNATSIMTIAFLAVAIGCVVFGIHPWSIDWYQPLVQYWKHLTFGSVPFFGLTTGLRIFGF